MDTKLTETDEELEKALQLVFSGKKNSEELRLARARGDEFRRQIRAKYGPRNIAVPLIREIRDGE